MGEFVINAGTFENNLLRILQAWKGNRGEWEDADALCFCQGQIDDEMLSYSQSSTFQILTFGTDFSDTIFAIFENEILIITNEAKSIKYITPLLKTLSESTSFHVPINVCLKKKNESNKESFDKLFASLRKSFNGKRFGLFSKEKSRWSGPFMDEFRSYLQGQQDWIECNINRGFAKMEMMKTDYELDNIRKACYVSIKAMKNGFFKEMENYYNNERNIKQSRFSGKLYNMIENNSEKLGLKNIDTDKLETCHDPIIQSGGHYSFSYNTTSSEDDLSFDVIMCTIGARYNHYCSNITRTYFINPTAFQEKCYRTLLKLYDYVILELKPGRTLGEVYDKTKKYLEGLEPSLVPYFYKNLGYSMGVELVESYGTIKSGSEVVVERNMCFNLRVGFDKVVDSEMKDKEEGNGIQQFSLLIGETVVVSSIKSDSLTTSCDKEWDQVSFEVGDEDDESESEGGHEDDNSLSIAQRLAMARRRAEAEEGQDERTRREEHQKKIYAELVKRKLASIQPQEDKEKEETKKVIEDIEAYKSTEEYPPDLKRSQLYVDMDKKVVFVPIYRVPIPFHISTIKSVSQMDEKNGSSFRINFHTPQTRTKDISEMMSNALDQFPSATYIKTIVVRCADRSNMNIQMAKIKELQKMTKQQHNLDKQVEGLVKQKDLILNHGQKVVFLNNIKVRPVLGSRQNVGRLEAHENGFRFVSTRGDRVDILFDNIKHALFQPCYKTLYVILHFHLKNAILIGKKRCTDIQFYTEVEEKAKEINEYRASSYDPDEVEQEQREHEKRRRLNDAFDKFTKQVPSVYFDKPYMKMAFTGSYENSHVDLIPSKYCLCNLTEAPIFVYSLNEIEHVQFERVNAMTHNFDMTLIFSDYNRFPVRISSIDRSQLDAIMIWLDTINITFSEHPSSFNWENIMTMAKDQASWWSDKDEEGQYKPPGWMSLTVDDGDENEDENDANGDDNFEPDEEDDYEEDDDDDDDDLVDFDEEEEEESSYEEEEEEDEEDEWEAQERLAAEQDKKARDKEYRRNQRENMKRRH